MGVQGHVDARFGPVRECFTEVGFDRVDTLENTLRDCLGLPPVPA